MRRRPERIAIALIGYAIVQSVLYASLLPLWEGFDEPFHYGYVQALRTGGGLPVLRQTVLSQEIVESLKLAPQSHVVQRNIPFTTSYGEYFKLPPAERQARRTTLEGIDPGLALKPSVSPNYEAAQAPLAYALLSIPDRLLASAGLLTRVWVLRVICGAVASVALALIALRFGTLLGMNVRFRYSLAFVLLSLQNWYATTAHIGNDWLAALLAGALLVALAELHRIPDFRRATLAGAVLAAGLLTKSYFLAFVPLSVGAAALLAFRRRLSKRALAAFLCAGLLAAPWYARNVALYRNLSGMQEGTGGVAVFTLVGSAAQVPWFDAFATAARSSIWVGNNTLNTFSSATTHAMLALLVAGLVLFAVAKGRTRPNAAEWIAVAASVSFAGALAYESALVFHAYEGRAYAPAAWHLPPLIIALYAVALAGLANWGRAGNGVRVAMAWLWTYVIGATYLVKLIPFYSGYEGPSKLAQLWKVWTNTAGTGREVLATVALAPPWFVLALTVFALALAAFIAAALSPVRDTPAPGFFEGENEQSDRRCRGLTR